MVNREDPGRKDREAIVREKFQVTLPAYIRENVKIKVGDVLLWEYDENNDTITVIKKPQSFTGALSGLGKKTCGKTGLRN